MSEFALLLPGSCLFSAVLRGLHDKHEDTYNRMETQQTYP